MLEFALACIFLTAPAAGYRIGAAMSDVTGPIDVVLMGYGVLHQRGNGIHLRQWSRAFIVEDGLNRLAFVSVDLGMVGDGLRIEVVRKLEKMYGGLYNMDNVVISATHTHSAPGGFLMHTFFDIPSSGFCKETFEALVTGIVKSVRKAHERTEAGRIYLSMGVLHEANINRSPNSYEANPEEEKKRYKYNVDKDMVQLKFVSEKGLPLGVINWFAVHATSMNNTNTLISSDNMGYASIMFEERMNPGSLIGKGSFVAAFASSNLGDVSPNTRGPLCHKSGTECDIHSKCEDEGEECYAKGPGGDDLFESTRIIADKLLDKAWELWKNRGVEITGPVKAIHQYVDMPKAEAEIFNAKTGKIEKVRGCNPAMGYSAGAGTTDGPFLPFLKQGTTEHIWWVDAITQVLVKPTEEDVKCHAPKPILLSTGRIKVPFDWQPSIVSTQVAFLGNLTLACVPGEFTTMSGRRLREAIAATVKTDPKYVIIVGLCNTYSDYIATHEEYQVQRYEAASTIYGPHTLSLHLSQFKKLAAALMKNKTLERGPEPKGLDKDKMLSLIAPVLFDSASPNKFGDVLVQPPKEVHPGNTVTVTFSKVLTPRTIWKCPCMSFSLISGRDKYKSSETDHESWIKVSGHPRNDLRLDDTYLTVERLKNGNWTIIATDANWQTKMRWRLTSRRLKKSEIDVEWSIPKNAVAGSYRIRHFGAFKITNGDALPYQDSVKSLASRAENTVNYIEKFPRRPCLLPNAWREVKRFGLPGGGSLPEMQNKFTPFHGLHILLSAVGRYKQTKLK